MFRYYHDIVRADDSSLKKNEQPVNVYCCDFCSDEYLSETEVDIHRKSKHREALEDIIRDPKKNVCKLCAVQYTTRDILIKHMKTIHLLCTPESKRIVREIFICNYCQQIYFNKQLLSIHITHHHLFKDKFTTIVECPKCNKMLKLQNIWHHFQYHEIQSISSCPICLTKCKDRSDLQEHLKTHPYHFYCDMCGYTTRKEENFNSHVETHCKSKNVMLNKDEEYYTQYFMPKPIISHTPWTQKHWGWKGVTMPESMYVCILCRHICMTTMEMMMHIENDHKHETEMKKKRYVCACGEEFFNNILLKHHVFKLKEDHRVLADHEIPEPSAQSS